MAGGAGGDRDELGGGSLTTASLYAVLTEPELDHKPGRLGEVLLARDCHMIALQPRWVGPKEMAVRVYVVDGMPRDEAEVLVERYRGR